MNTKEALQALAAGKKLRLSYWHYDCYIYLSDEEGMLNEHNQTRSMKFMPNDEWELYEEPQVPITYQDILHQLEIIIAPVYNNNTQDSFDKINYLITEVKSAITLIEETI